MKVQELLVETHEGEMGSYRKIVCVRPWGVSGSLHNNLLL